ncbi:putative sugar nucleotidyl transferase [Brumimicrobium aurantiacum]|uniref:Glucose-1-phosphate thymidylyltransferase n=1 Tax=Brumimicrobium aurantiacum TaxID=1737063 RepID=A0A3E1EUY2_9FLAO|nr:putative sugar nucleotidyl transferase [Brumimicrobium aurantiacum]RFC53338.1 glucose-1-phosphate thymidylyltransferase [Brumimicrobium aurantiacum]
MNIILHDLSNHLKFAPLSLTRPIGNLRAGLWTNDERWQFYFPEANISFQTEEHISEKFPLVKEEDNVFVNATVVPSPKLIEKIKSLRSGDSLWVNNVFVAYRGAEYEEKESASIELDELIVLENRWDLYQKNDQILRTDFAAYTSGKTSAALSNSNTLIGDTQQLFIEEGATVECAILNVKSGPIYIGKNAEIMEGSVVRGGLAMAESSVLKLSTKVYGATSLGPHCKVGGEVNNVIFQAYSNKGHDGFLGNSLIGEWCNLGADTNSSNLKNNYGNVKTYSYLTRKMELTELMFMGVTMGDHSKTSINTMLNTATVIGVCANLFSAGFPPKFVPDFSWGGEPNPPVYDFDRAVDAANQMMIRRGKAITDGDLKILKHLFPK